MELILLNLPVLGLVELPWWGYVVITLMVTHITIASITIYLHRFGAHRALHLHPVTQHLFRFWLWFATGTVTREWVAVHRRHHAKVETKEDPHSPQIHGIKKLLTEGYELYREGAADPNTLEKYGFGMPDDWVEHNVYRKTFLGIAVLCILNVVLFGAIGLVMWVVMMLWQPFFAAGVINGLGHWSGYRNFEVQDASTNLVPWGILIGGEELHNNHHAYPSSARLSNRWYEFDIGWAYIKIMEFFGLAWVKKVAPRPHLVPSKSTADLDTLKALLINRFQIMSNYAKTVLAQVHQEELQRDGADRTMLKSARRLLAREESLLNPEAKARLHAALAESQALAVVYEYKQRLQAIWQERSMTQEVLLQALDEWCVQAEQSGIRALQEFARRLPSYSTQPAPA
ncbi:MAG: acyl-CoA desaturase [Thiotrichales bacterium]|nr:acyl-CoA desaturase [Thiotrichales bacterium]